MFHKLSFLIVVTALGVGCAPKLVVRHEDPTHSLVHVELDGAPAGFVAFGDRFVTRVARGYHRIETKPQGVDTNPWAEDGQGWTFYVDRRAELTLLPVE